MTPKREPGGASPGTPAPPGPAETFEAMMERLEGLVERLEAGNLSLEESIRAFEEGVGLVKKCTAVLGEAEQRVKRLTRDASGAPRAETAGEEDRGPDGGSDEIPF